MKDGLKIRVSCWLKKKYPKKKDYQKNTLLRYTNYLLSYTFYFNCLFFLIFHVIDELWANRHTYVIADPVT
jgi:hypothetical protein